MELREIKIIIKEYVNLLIKHLINSLKGLKILTKILDKKAPKLKKRIISLSVKVYRITIILCKELIKGFQFLSFHVYNVIRKLINITSEGFLLLLNKFLPRITKKYIKPFIKKIIEIIGKIFFKLMHIINKTFGKLLDKTTEKISKKVKTIKAHPEQQYKFLEDIVKINMIISPIYLITLITLFIIWSLTNKLTSLSLTTIYLTIPLVLIICIPFFSYYNLLKNETFTITDLLLNMIFLLLILISIIVFIVKII